MATTITAPAVHSLYEQEEEKREVIMLPEMVSISGGESTTQKRYNVNIISARDTKNIKSPQH